jgi:hypothetical protein
VFPGKKVGRFPFCKNAVILPCLLQPEHDGEKRNEVYMLNFDDVIAAQHTLTTNQSKLRFLNNLLKSRSSNLILFVAQKDQFFFFSVIS